MTTRLRLSILVFFESIILPNLIGCATTPQAGTYQNENSYRATYESTVHDCVRAAKEIFTFVSSNELHPYCECVLDQTGVTDCKTVKQMSECFNSKYLVAEDAPTVHKAFIAKAKENCISKHLAAYDDRIPAAIKEAVFQGQKRIILKAFSKTDLNEKQLDSYVNCIVRTYLNECKDQTYSGYLVCLNNEDNHYLVKTIRKCEKHLTTEQAGRTPVYLPQSD